SQTIKDRRKHVAALLVGAEQERTLAVGGPERRDARVHQLQLRRVERVLDRKQRGEDRGEKEQGRDRRGEHGDAGAAEGVEKVAFNKAFEPAFGREAGARSAGLGLARKGGIAHGLIFRNYAGRLMVERRRGSTTV